MNKISIISGIMAFVMLLMSILSIMPILSFAEGNVGAEYVVKDGLVAHYDGVKNTRSGHNSNATVWEDLAGNYDITVGKTEKDYFTENSYHLKSSQYNFAPDLLALINSSEFTVELTMGSIKQLGGSFATFINNSGNDNFSLFRRVDGDYIEFKCGSGARPKVRGGLDYFTDSTVAITYKVGEKCRMYVDGVLIDEKDCKAAIGATGNFFFGHSGSTKNYEGDFEAMRFYSRALSAEEVAVNARADGNLEGDIVVPEDIFAVLQPKTNIIGDLAICEYINTLEELQKYMRPENGEEPDFVPSNLVFHLNDDGKVIDNTGNTVIAELSDVFSSASGRFIPIFEISTTKAADSLVSYMKENGLIDAAVKSSDKKIISYARKSGTFLRGIIDFSEKYKGKEISDDELVNIRRTCTESMALTAVLPSESVTRDNVLYLNSLRITTWLSMENESNDSYIKAVASGAYGIITENGKALYDCTNEYFPPMSMTRPTAIIGHRGLPSKVAENTLESAIAAYEAGADIIECDVYLSKDGEIVVNHDSTTTKYNKVISVESSTLEELKELNYNGYKLPTLREFFEEFKGKDVMLFVEIKSSRAQMPKVLKKLVDEYDMYSQCTVIAYESTGQLSDMLRYYPEMPVSFLQGGFSKADMPYLLPLLGKYNTSNSPDKSGCDEDYVRATLLRGITSWPYTFTSLSDETKYISYGHAGITTNYADHMTNMVDNIRLTSLDSGKLAVIGETKGRKEITVDAEVFIISGDGAEIVDGEIVFNNEETVTVGARYKAKLGDLEYILTAEPVTVTKSSSQPTPTPDDTTSALPSDTPTPAVTPDGNVTATPEPADTDTENDPISPAVIVVIIVVALAVFGAVMAIAAKKRR